MPLPLSKRATADDVLAELDLEGKVALVTGANAGIGYETARSLAAAGVTVYCACRSAEKAETTVASIQASHPGADPRPFVVDLGDLAQIRQACAGFEGEALNAVIANAGLFGGGYRETTDGFESTVGVCHFGHAELIRGLLPALEAGAPSRVVMVASDSHRTARNFDPEAVSVAESQYSELSAYDRAKLCNVLYANALDERVKEQGIRAVSLHPATMVPTELSRSSWLAKIGMALYRPFAKTLAQAAATSVWAAFHPELDGQGGVYLTGLRIVQASAKGRDPDLATRLWIHTEQTLDERARASSA